MDAALDFASPELRWLVALLRCALRPADAPAVPGAIDWDRLGGLGQRHGVEAFLHARLPPAARALLPAALQAAWRDQARRAAGHALQQSGEILRLTALLAAAGIRSASLKGPLLARQLYGGLGQRRAGDVDLLVAPADAAPADAALRRAGYVRSRPDFVLTPRQERVYRSVHYEFEYAAPGGLRVELLWRLEGLPAANPWAGAVSSQLGDVAVWTLPPDLNALYLFQHGARHGWYRLFWLVDVALLLRDGPLDWPGLAARARRDGTERPLLQGAALAARLLGVTIPPALEPSPAEHRMVGALAAEACRQIAGRVDASAHTGEWLRQLAYRLRLSRGLRSRWTVLRPHLVSLSSWKMIRLPDRLFWLYHPLTPFLWLWRRCRS